jgi:uncharacterized Zn finger protein (UPF0148 family)
METCPKHGTPLLLRRNQATGEIALACLQCDVEERGGREREKKQVAEAMQKKPPGRA